MSLSMSRETFRRITKSSALVAGATALTFAFSLLSLAINARALGAHQFGLLAVVQAYFAFVSGLTTFDNWQPVVRLGVRSPKRISLIISSGLALDVAATAAGAVLATLGLLAFRHVLGIDVDAGLALYFYAVSMLTCLGGTPKGYFRLKGRFDVLATNQLAFGLLLLVSSLGLWLAGASLETYLYVFAVITAFPAVSILARMLLMMRREGLAVTNPFASPSRRHFFRHVLRLATGNSILSTLLTSRHQVALFIISSIVGSSAAGLFAVATRCANAFTRMVVPVNQVLFPELLKLASEGDPVSVRRSMRRTAVGLVIVGLALGMLASMSSTLIVTVAAGREFSGAADVFWLLLVAEVALWFGYYFNPIILHTSGQMPILKANGFLAILTFLAATAFAHQFGILGVGVALMAGAICNCATLYALAEVGVRQTIQKRPIHPAHV